MATESNRLAGAINPDGPVDQAVLGLRMGEVKCVYIQEGKVDITLGGASGDELIPRVPHLSNFQPLAGDYIWVVVNGNDLLVLDRTSLQGPSVISRATSGVTEPAGARTSTAWGDLATPGPSTHTFISPSGRCLISIGGHISNDSATAGAAMSFEITPYDPVGAPDRDGYAYTNPDWTMPPSSERGFLTNRAGAGRVIGGSRECLLEGIPSGNYSFTAKYCAITGGTARFQQRSINVIPL